MSIYLSLTRVGVSAFTKIINLNLFHFCPSSVHVELVDASSSTDVRSIDRYGCQIENKFYAEGAQVPSSEKKPCELCYCIRNATSCVMQECTLHVDGCRPIYNRGVCCPVRYECGKSRTERSRGEHFSSSH